MNIRHSATRSSIHRTPWLDHRLMEIGACNRSHPRCWASLLSVFMLAVLLPSITNPAFAQVSRVASAMTHKGTPTAPISLAKIDTMVLCPPQLLDALQPWVAYREAQGRRVYVARPGANAFEIKQQIRQLATVSQLKTVWIIGDVRSVHNHGSNAVSTDYMPAQAIRKYGSEPEIATDHTFADLDGDQVPDLVIGRLPVNTPQELEEQISKIIRYEQLQLSPEGQGLWKRKINFIAGTGGFGFLADQMIEKISKRLISDMIPPEFQTSITYASWTSPYCPDPSRFSEATVKRLNEGCLFWVYIGHGRPQQLDFIRTPRGGFPILKPRQISEVHSVDGMPIAILLVCYTGAFDLNEDCLAEQLIKRPNGPIAVLCGTRLTTPYGMSLLSIGLMEQYFDQRVSTLGELLLAAKRDLIVNHSEPGDTNSSYREHIELLNRALCPREVDWKQERVEHAYLFHLLGDPLLRLPQPQSLNLQVRKEVGPSERLVVSGIAPYEGQLMLQLNYARDRLIHRVRRRREFDATPLALAEYQTTYQEANNRQCDAVTAFVPAGPFSIELVVPVWASGACVVQGILQGADQFSLGARPLQVQRQKRTDISSHPLQAPTLER